MNFELHLETETVDRVDSAPPLCVTPGTVVREVIDNMRQSETGHALVCEQGAICGIFTERDALSMMAAGADFDVPVEVVMTRDPESLSASAAIGDAIKRMTEGGYRQLPLVNSDNKPTRMLRAADILRHLVDHFPEYVYNLPPTPHHSTQQREGA